MGWVVGLIRAPSVLIMPFLIWCRRSPKLPLPTIEGGEQGSNLLWNATHYLLSIPSYRPGWRTELKISPALWIHKPHTQQIIFMFVMLLWIENMRAMNSQNSHAEQMVLNQMLSWGFYKLWTHHAPEGLCKSLLPGIFSAFTENTKKNVSKAIHWVKQSRLSKSNKSFCM